MIAIHIHFGEEAKSRLRASSLEFASRVLREDGLSGAADYVDSLGPVSIRVTPSACRSVSACVKDSDTAVRSARRSGLRYVAALLRASGAHDHAARHLECFAEERIPTSETQAWMRRFRGARSARGNWP